VKVTSLVNLGQKYITVHVVIIEKEIIDIVSSFGENKFESVARTMLPEADGTSYNIQWDPGTSREFDLNYYYQDIFNDDEVHIVAFVQDNGTREVYQAEMVPADPLLGIGDEIEENRQLFQVYPNPTQRYTNIKFAEPLAEEVQVQIMDHCGRIISIQEINRGEQVQSINISKYNPGIYIVCLITENEVIAAQKLLILDNNR
jgi:hypothetical protein